MLVCDAVRLMAYLALAIMVLRDAATLGLVIAVTVIGSACNALFGTAEHSALRNIVWPEQLPAAVARNEARIYATSLAGPPIGGLLFGLGPIAAVLRQRGHLSAVADRRRCSCDGRCRNRASSKPGRTATAMIEGLRFVFGDPFLRADSADRGAAEPGHHGIIFTIIVTLQRHGTPPAVIGTVETIVAVGGLLGALAAPALHRRLRLPVLIRGICWTAAVLMAISALLTSSVAAAIPIAAAVFLGPASNAALFGHQAAITPDRLQGRVVSVVIVVATSVASAAPLLAGAMITAWGSSGGGAGVRRGGGGSAVAATVSRGIRSMRPVEELAA